MKSLLKENNQFQCSICKKFCSNNFNFKRHNQRHHSTEAKADENITLINCEQCSKKFPNFESLMNHVKKHKRKTVTHKCEECDKHIKVCHTKMLCKMCKNSFPTSKEMKKHILSH